MNSVSETGDVLFATPTGLTVFRKPVEVVCAHTVDTVCASLQKVEAAVDSGLHAAGFLAFEAAPAFDRALVCHAPDDFPLLWFGLYAEKETRGPLETNGNGFSVGEWQALVGEEEYRRCIARIRELIAAGDTYQVNYTFPMQTTFAGDPLAWFARLCQAQGGSHSAYVDTGRFRVLSASPELFFSLDGERIETRPMKGTRPRGRWAAEDIALERELAESDKDRAENVMIVDLLRNDMGRISVPGSVSVASLFDVERYETVWQMTSTITAQAEAPVSDILTALFPSGSVTGAPKVRTMEIIRELEPHPRGVYCGSVGWWSPGRKASFNVAIRTVTVDSETGLARYNVGGGITWGSTATGEFDECYVKAALLSARRPMFELLESLLFDGEYFLLEEHVKRLGDTAAHFGFEVNLDPIRQTLLDVADDLEGPHKVRLCVPRNGACRVEVTTAADLGSWRVGLAQEPVDSSDVFLYHKTTNRSVYNRAKASRLDCNDALLWNERGELTESTIANLVLEIDGAQLTPPLHSGLLPGTMRGHLLATGEVREAVLTKDDLNRASRIRLVNSVRKWIDVDFVALQTSHDMA